jgi:hypothetical protein
VNIRKSRYAAYIKHLPNRGEEIDDGNAGAASSDVRGHRQAEKTSIANATRSKRILAIWHFLD